MSKEPDIELGITITADDSNFIDSINACELAENQLVRKWDRDSRRLHSEMSRVVRSIRGVVRLVQEVFSAFGIALDPVAEAFLGMIMTTMTSILTIHRTLEASSMGLAAAVTIGLSLGAIELSMANFIRTQQGFDEAKEMIRHASSIVDATLAISLPLTFGGGYYY